MLKVLVVYDSKAGSTAEVADFIAKTLKEEKLTVDLVHVNNTNSISGYNAVIVGSGVRAGRWFSGASGFIKKNKEDLSKLPVFYFQVCMTLKDDNEKTRKEVDKYMDPLRSIVKPVDTASFAGKMDYSKLGFIYRFVVKKMVKVPEGDFRNWEEIKNWTKTIPNKL